MNHDTIIIIPARLQSMRLKEKMLLKVGDKSIIQWVYSKANQLGIRVVGGVSDEIIAKEITTIGGECVLTNPDLPSGTDRVWATLQAIDPNRRIKRIINIQGDQPFMPLAVIKACMERLIDDSKADMTSVCVPFPDKQTLNNPNQVKVVLGQEQATQRNYGLYFSRNPIPYGASSQDPYYLHLGIYGYQREALERFVNLRPSPLETRERLEQLRALENGMRIGMECVTPTNYHQLIAIDTQEDYDEAKRIYEAGLC